LYSNILNKHIGWFDNRENAPSVLSATMAKDTSIVNGVSTESVSPTLEGMLALVFGLIIGFYLCWEMSLAMLGVAPIMAIGGMLEMKAMKGNMTEDDEKDWKESNLLSGDAIVNFRTV
jgi:ABC-type multidrug transport system fused ATPase/permease subunit